MDPPGLRNCRLTEVEATGTLADAMPNLFRVLVVSNSDDFHAELIERTGRLDLAVKATGFAPELAMALETHGFDWVVLDLDMDTVDSAQVIGSLARTGARLVLIGADEVALASARAAAAAHGLDVAGTLSRPVSRAALAGAMDRRADGTGAVPPDSLLGGRVAIPDDEIEIHYQPLISIEDRVIRGVEALVRWRHPAHGLLEPSRFIALAERTGAIVPLTWTVLRKAVHQQVAWKKQGTLLAVSVNISTLFLASLQTAEEMLGLLDREGFDPGDLTLEITESEAAHNPPLANLLLSRLREAGVAVSMDDYGVGFSNLKRLSLFPFSDLKIDRWLVAELGKSAEARRTVEMLVALAARERFTLTGEGIETEEQWQTLRDLGCHFAQGYLIAHPMPGDSVRGWIGRMRESGRYQPALV
jgi:EAL domain-containing protein (putative c-di-GMP-specific phosphodiesterase class I)